jgi:hypothetical protein
MNRRFQAAAGSIVGTAHLHAGRNGQDGFAIHCQGEVTVAVVTDGCGSAPHSEVGAKIGAAIVARCVAQGGLKPAPTSIIEQLRAVAVTLGDDLETVVSEYLLFTIVGVVIAPEETIVFSAGDGMFAINGMERVIGPYPGNAPPYLGYALIDGNEPGFTIEHRGPTWEIESIVIATDGAARLAGSLYLFSSDDRVFRNPDAVRRKLFRLTRHGSAVLDDDTTVVVLRRLDAA